MKQFIQFQKGKHITDLHNHAKIDVAEERHIRGTIDRRGMRTRQRDNTSFSLVTSFPFFFLSSEEVTTTERFEQLNLDGARVQSREYQASGGADGPW